MPLIAIFPKLYFYKSSFSKSVVNSVSLLLQIDTIIVNNKYKFYITDKFIARDIGNEVTWNSGASAYIGRVPNNAYYVTNANYFIKNISMYSLNYF